MRIALYQPDIPQNLGAMIRLCACFGIQIDLIEPCGFPFSLKAIRRTAMDYIDIVKIDCHDDFDSFIQKYKSKRIFQLIKELYGFYDNFKTIKTSDFTINSRILIGDMVATAINNGLEISLNNEVLDINNNNDTIYYCVNVIPRVP